MDANHTVIFITELETQASFALYAIERVKDSLATGSVNRIFFYTQAFLSAVGNVSKLLWPSSTKIPGRGARIEESSRNPQ